jgi:hypothetical protein
MLSLFLARVVLLNGQQTTRPHAIDCKIYGQCTDPSCGYIAGHPELRAVLKERTKVAKEALKKKSQDQAAMIAGMRPPTSAQFDTELKHIFAESNLDR